MARRNVKATVRQFLEGNVEGLRSVYEGVVANNRGPFPTVVIRLPNEDEQRVSMPALTGRKSVTTTVRLLVIDVNTEPTVEAELAFDDLVDRVEAAIRANPTLGVDTVLQVGGRIRTRVAEPVLAGQTQGGVYRGATIEFEVLEHVVG